MTLSFFAVIKETSTSVNADNLNKLLAEGQQLIADFGIRLITAAIVFFVGRWVARQLQRFIRKAMTKAKMDPNLVSFLSNITFYAIVGFVIIIALGQLGIETSALLAILGAAGVAVGLALQGALSNFAAGILIVIFHPFRVGDWIEGAGVSGYVEEIELFTTIMRTLDNKTVIIPNSKLTSDNIINYSTKGILRVELVVGVAYGEDIDRTKRAIETALAQDHRILKTPPPVIEILELADSSVNFAVYPWTDTDNYWPVYYRTHEMVKKQLDKEGITIPFPQRDVHLYQHPALNGRVDLNGAEALNYTGG